MRFAEPSAAPANTPKVSEDEPCSLSACDSHKDTLAACLVDQLGTPVEYRNISNTPAGHRQLVDWAQTQNAARMAIEGSGAGAAPRPKPIRSTRW